MKVNAIAWASGAALITLSLLGTARAQDVNDGYESASGASSSASTAKQRLALPPPLPANPGKPARLPAPPPGSRLLSPPPAATPLSVVTDSVRKKSCTVGLKRAPALEVPADAAEIVVTFTREAGTNCLNAASAEARWVDAQLESANDRVVLVIEANPKAIPRSTAVYAVTNSQSFVLRVRQAAGQGTTTDQDE